VTTTWNPADQVNMTLSGGNLVATAGISAAVRSLDRVYSGKYYWEVTFTTAVNGLVGVLMSGAALSGWQTNSANGAQVGATGNIFLNGASAGINIGAFANGAICCVALDASARLVWLRNGAAGNWNNNAGYSPGGTGGLALANFPTPWGWYAAGGGNGGSVLTANFGGSTFAGAVPGGYTSGFPSGTTLINADVVTQAAIEQFAAITPPQMQVTQVALEDWVTVNVTNPYMSVTQAAIEQWGTVALAPTGPPQKGGILLSGL